jgi:hypothetical protein
MPVETLYFIFSSESFVIHQNVTVVGKHPPPPLQCDIRTMKRAHNLAPYHKDCDVVIVSTQRVSEFSACYTLGDFKI